MDFTLYYAAINADDTYHRALVDAYGGKASDMRYKPAQQSPEIRELGNLKHQADEKWLAYSRSHVSGISKEQLADLQSDWDVAACSARSKGQFLVEDICAELERRFEADHA